jgi:hypothetical protein
MKWRRKPGTSRFAWRPRVHPRVRLPLAPARLLVSAHLHPPFLPSPLILNRPTHYHHRHHPICHCRPLPRNPTRRRPPSLDRSSSVPAAVVTRFDLCSLSRTGATHPLVSSPSSPLRTRRLLRIAPPPLPHRSGLTAMSSLLSWCLWLPPSAHPRVSTPPTSNLAPARRRCPYLQLNPVAVTQGLLYIVRPSFMDPVRTISTHFFLHAISTLRA